MKKEVSTSTSVGSPRAASANVAQSLPSPRRRAFSQPSPVVRARPGRIRFAGRGVEGVRGVEQPAAVLEREQVDGRGQEPRVDHDLAVHPEPGHAAVGVDREPDVGPAPVARRPRSGSRESPSHGDRSTSVVHVQLLEHRVLGVALDGQPLHRDVRRVVALERRRVDHHAAHDAGHAEAHDRGVIAGLAPPPRLPPVVDLAAVPEWDVRVEPGRAGQDQVLPLGERLVVGPRRRCRRARARRDRGRS